MMTYGRNLRIKVMGQGPIYDEVTHLLQNQWQTLVGKPPYDLLILANYTRILPKEELEQASIGTLCFHPSLLPRHRGRDAVYWTLAHNDATTGVTWFWIDEGIDTGPIAIQRAIPVPEGVKAGHLYYSYLVPLGVQLLGELLPMLTKGDKPMTVQDESKATYEHPRGYVEINAIKWIGEVQHV